MRRSVYAVELRLRRPLVTAGGVRKSRHVFVLRADVNGESRWSEAAPLDGWGSESVQECRDALIKWARSGIPPSTPAAAYAVDTLREDFRSVDVETQFTLGSVGITQTVAEIASAVQAGFETVKLKVGVDSVSDDVQKLLEVSRSFPRVRLRVDANGAWSLADAVKFAQGSQLASLDLIEQPVPPSRLKDLRHLTQLQLAPIAADESANNPDLRAELLEDATVDAVVLKPSVFGEIECLRAYVEAAKDTGVRVIFSSAIETSLGRNQVAQLAQSLGVMEPSGLNTGDWLDRDIPWGEVQAGHLRVHEPLSSAIMEQYLRDSELIIEAEMP